MAPNVPSDRGFLDPAGKCGGWVGRGLGQPMHNPLWSLQRDEQAQPQEPLMGSKDRAVLGECRRDFELGRAEHGS